MLIKITIVEIDAICQCNDTLAAIPEPFGNLRGEPYEIFAVEK